MRFVHPYRSTLTRLACLSAAIVLPAVAGSTPAPQDSCAPLADQAAAATGLSDADAKAGLAQAESLITRAAAAGCPLAGLRAQAARGDNLLTLGRYQEAEDVYQQLSKTLDPGGPSILLAGVLRRLGAAYYFTGELDRALQQYRASIGVAQKIGDRMDVAKAQGDIGALYVQIGWLDEARQAQEEALAGYQEVQWKPGIAGTANNMSQVDGGMGDRALASGDDAAARTHYAAMYHAARQAFQEFQDLHNTRGIAVASANVGIAAAALGHYHEAIGWHRRALALRRRIGDVQGQVNSLATMAVTLIGLGSLDDAEARLREADRLAGGLAPSDRKLVAQSWVRLSRARGDYAGALDHLSEVLRLNDVISAADYGTRVKELETRNQTARMEQEIGLLQGKQTIADLRFARNRLWLTLAGITSLLLTAVFVVLLRAFRASRRAARELEHAVRTDPLTGLTNRVGVYERIEYERLRSDRSKQPFSFALIDVDDFKAVNDAHGHEVGDTVLAQVAQRISAQLRAQDTAARWGGEEFLLLLPETCASGAAVLAHKVREAVGKAGVPVNGRELPLTLTVGLCEYHAGITVGECIKAADQAMYAGKQAGKNQVVVCAAGETPAA